MKLKVEGDRGKVVEDIKDIFLDVIVGNLQVGCILLIGGGGEGLNQKYQNLSYKTFN